MKIRFTASLVRDSLKEGDVFADIGAHHGYYSLMASVCVGSSGTVMAFEPDPGNQAILRKNTELGRFENITLIPEAVSDTFDEYCGDHIINVFKIATGDHEPWILKGMEQAIGRNPQIRIFLEFSPCSLEGADYSPEALLDDLDQLGLDICFIDDQEQRIYRYDPANRRGYHKILKNRATLNLLCFKKGMYPLVHIFSHSAWMTGAEKTLLNMVDAMRQEGFLVHVTLPGSGPMENELRVRHVSTDYKKVHPWILSGIQSNTEYFENLKEVLPGLLSETLLINPHLIISNTSVIAHGALVAAITGTPHFWRISEFGMPEYGIHHLFDADTRKAFVAWASDKVLFSSRTLMSDFSAYITENQSGIFSPGLITPYPATPEPVSFSSDNIITVLYPATIIPGKRQLDLVRALIILKKRGYRNFRVVLVGSGPPSAYHQELDELIESEDLENFIRIKPFSEDISAEYRDAAMVVSCSLMESFGRIVIEGMAYGKLVIGAASGGTLELIRHGETGLLFEPGNPEDLADKMLFALTHPEEIKQIIENGRAFSRRFFGSGGFEALPDLVREFIRPERDLCRFSMAFLHEYIPWVLHLIEMKNSYSAIEQENASMKEEISRLKQENANILENNLLIREEIANIIASRSWRISAPLRWLFKKLGLS